jgi:DNA polymerase-1
MQGEARLPKDLVRTVQQQLMAEDGITHPFNIQAKHHLKKLFFETLGEKPTSTTDKGNPQVEDDFLESMADKYEWVKWLRTYNKLSKIESTYVDTYLEDNENGIFYPSYKMHGTVSGRFSGNMQQLPKALEEGQVEDPVVMEFTNRIRHFFISGSDKVFVDVDYAQLEPTVFSHVSNDKPLQDVFRNKVDFYSQVIIEMNGLHDKYSSDKAAPNYLGKLDKPLRNFAKTIALGFPYGYTPYKLHKELNISEAEAERHYNNYFKAFPNLAAWMVSTKESILKTETVKTQSGRVRRVPGLKATVAEYGTELFHGLELWKKYHECGPVYTRAKEAAKWVKNSINSSYNFQIQGLAASIVNRSAIAIAREFKARGMEAYICLQVHDELCVLCNESDKLVVGEIMQRLMEGTYTLSVPLVAEPSCGYTYAESKG